MAIGYTKLTSYHSPVNLSLGQQGIYGLERAACKYRFQIELLEDGIKEFGCGAIRGHELIPP